LQDNPHVLKGSLFPQAEALIIEPLTNAAVPAAAELRPRVVIIDDMDESQGQQNISETIGILCERLGFPLVFLATSRRAQNIQAAFHREPLRSLTTRLDLHAHNLDSDIRLFLQSKLSRVTQQGTRYRPPGHLKNK